MRRTWIGLLLLAGCGGASGEAPAPTGAAAARPSPPSPAPGGQEASPEGPPSGEAALDGKVTAATRGITADEVGADVRVLAGLVGEPDRLTAAARHVAEELREAGFEVSRQPVTHAGRTADNLVADRAGSDPSRVVLVAAHYDVVEGSPGADDNASGVAAMLAVARATGRVPTRASLRMVSFAFEEDELAGSAAYVQSLPEPERRRIVLAIVFDMVGYRTRAPRSQQFPDGIEALAPGREIPTVGDFIGVIGLTDTPAGIRERLRASRAYAGDLRIETLAVPPEAVMFAPDLLRGDHASFWLADVPALGVTDTGDFRNPEYHGATDTPETLDLDFVRDVARWATAATLLLAEPE